MSLDVELVIDTGAGNFVSAYENNITHNLTAMANAAHLYFAIWQPDRYWSGPITKASELIPILEEGLSKLKNDPEYYSKFNPSNGWGNYDIFVSFVESYLYACKKHPNTTINVYR